MCATAAGNDTISFWSSAFEAKANFDFVSEMHVAAC